MPVVRYTTISGEIVAEKRNGVRSLYVPDSLGSTVALLDSSQNKTDTWKYWPNGEAVRLTGINPTPMLFVGSQGYHQDSTLQTYARARVVDPAKARWLTEDPIIDALNAYLYAYANPVRFRDPSGLAPVCQDRDQSPCSDILNPSSLDEISKKLLECLKKAVPNKKEIKKCTDKLAPDMKEKALAIIAEYIGCMAAGEMHNHLSGPHLNPCKPPSTRFEFECCHSNYIKCLIPCYKKRWWDITDCTGKCLRTFGTCTINAGPGYMPGA